MAADFIIDKRQFYITFNLNRSNCWACFSQFELTQYRKTLTGQFSGIKKPASAGFYDTFTYRYFNTSASCSLTLDTD
ncbi:hypothetical protein GCM10009411_21920 [Shewanella litoralis]|uniref:Uncharacterized protein n=1 Tax=Shewanella litoralis TaxID=2282700 RepID=A0ABQ2RBT8_9GAMM|nr:hypothetical protein GCM10009411_21920 [Shewanella litoralis]